jgi:hypothetical protein
LVEEDIKYKRRKNPSLQNTTSNMDNKGSLLLPNYGSVSQQHACNNPNRGHRQSSPSKSQQKLVVRGRVEGLCDIQGDQVDRSAESFGAMQLVCQKVRDILSTSPFAEAKGVVTKYAL